jgi:hypothetical protein
MARAGRRREIRMDAMRKMASIKRAIFRLAEWAQQAKASAVQAGAWQFIMVQERAADMTGTPFHKTVFSFILYIGKHKIVLILARESDKVNCSGMEKCR